MDTMIRILIADDHAFYREGVRVMLATAPEISVVGEAVTGEEAEALAISLQPDVVLMDIKMPSRSGIEATQGIVRASPHIRVLIITMFDDDRSVFETMRAGARGYLLKDARHDDLIRAIRAIYRGEAIFSPAIAQRMMQYFDLLHKSSHSMIFPELTEREREILALIAQGNNNEAIAAKLGLSLKTVRNNVSNILNKLQVNDRAQAIVKARDAGMGAKPE